MGQPIERRREPLAEHTSDDTKKTIDEFHNAIKMTAKELDSWLKHDESHGVGQKEEGDKESTGHESARLIAKILGKRRADHDDDDLAPMRRPVRYVH